MQTETQEHLCVGFSAAVPRTSERTNVVQPRARICSTVVLCPQGMWTLGPFVPRRGRIGGRGFVPHGLESSFLTRPSQA